VGGTIRWRNFEKVAEGFPSLFHVVFEETGGWYGGTDVLIVGFVGCDGTAFVLGGEGEGCGEESGVLVDYRE